MMADFLWLEGWEIVGTKNDRQLGGFASKADAARKRPTSLRAF
jgi:hypothetical protein